MSSLQNSRTLPVLGDLDVEPFENFKKLSSSRLVSVIEGVLEKARKLAAQGLVLQAFTMLGAALTEVQCDGSMESRPNKHVAIAAHNSALCAKWLGQTRQVCALHKMCLAYEIAEFGESHISVALRNLAIASTFSVHGDWDAAQKYHAAATNALETWHEPGHPVLAGLLAYHADMCLYTDQVPLARETLQKVDHIWDGNEEKQTPSEKAYVNQLRTALEHKILGTLVPLDVESQWAPDSLPWATTEELQQKGYWLNRVPDDEAQAVIASDPQSDGQGIVDVGMEHVQTINAEASSVMDEELANDRVSTRDTSETQSSDSRLAPISGAET